MTWIEQLGTRLAASLSDQTAQTLWINPHSVLLRNAFFIIVVLAHGFRRLLPPY